MNLPELRVCLRDITMSEANKTECLRTVVPHEQFAGHKGCAAEPVNFPPATSIVRPYDGLSQ